LFRHYSKLSTLNWNINLIKSLTFHFSLHKLRFYFFKKKLFQVFFFV
jgi:hypothetical protein